MVAKAVPRHRCRRLAGVCKRRNGAFLKIDGWSFQCRKRYRNKLKVLATTLRRGARPKLPYAFTAPGGSCEEAEDGPLVQQRGSQRLLLYINDDGKSGHGTESITQRSVDMYRKYPSDVAVSCMGASGTICCSLPDDPVIFYHVGRTAKMAAAVGFDSRLSARYVSEWEHRSELLRRVMRSGSSIPSLIHIPGPRTSVMFVDVLHNGSQTLNTFSAPQVLRSHGS
ncbi:hypothetical protein LIA77_09743 [Sarocladium implicatum]|nr:hypothetical protein LIA77_09743 [Sarocladium implicatum]